MTFMEVVLLFSLGYAIVFAFLVFIGMVLERGID